MKANQRVTISKRMLKEALFRLLEKKSLEKIRVSELCEEAGINRATFYRHYDVPRDILEESGREFVEQLLDLSACKDPSESPVSLLDVCRYLYENRRLAKTIFTHNTDEAMRRHMGEFFSMLRLRSKEAGPLAGRDETAARLMLLYTCGGCYHLLQEWILSDLPKSPEEIAEIILTLWKLP